MKYILLILMAILMAANIYFLFTTPEKIQRSVENAKLDIICEYEN